MSFVFALDRCEPHLVHVVGGKAVGLALLMHEGLRVPPGFAIGTEAHREFLLQSRLDGAIRGLLADADSLQSQADASARIGLLFAEHELQPRTRDELARAYADLGEPPVAVRSSARSEDAAGVSFAGQHETYLWIEGIDALAAAVVRCWGSLFTPRALAYFRRVAIRPEDAAMGVVVQAMVPAQAAGVMITLDPVTGDRAQITIEASLGLGEAVVSGEVTPDRYAVDKVTLEILSRTISAKHVAYCVDPATGERGLIDVPVGEQRVPCVSDDEIRELAAVGKRLERSLGAPLDLEWAISSDRDIHLLQMRPETVWTRRPWLAKPMGSPVSGEERRG